MQMGTKLASSTVWEPPLKDLNLQCTEFLHVYREEFIWRCYQPSAPYKTVKELNSYESLAFGNLEKYALANE